MGVSIKLTSSSMDGNLMVSDDQTLSNSTKSRIESQPASPFDDGSYLVIPQKHHNVKVTRNGVTQKSSRICVVNLDKGYARSMQLSQLNGSVSVIDKLDQVENPLETEDRPTSDGKGTVRRLKRGQMPAPVRALKSGYLPISVDGSDAVVTVPFFIKIDGVLQGYNVSYEERKDEPGVYDVALDQNNHVAFNRATYPSYEVVSDVKDADITKARNIINSDPQMKTLTNGRLLK